ncbi:MAG TPA: hypothetical protein VGS10_10710, partial [Terracidiphilus sp.]|nr:hypothetical protein [Terracidiphilus sp.]
MIVAVPAIQISPQPLISRGGGQRLGSTLKMKWEWKGECRKQNQAQKDNFASIKPRQLPHPAAVCAQVRGI